MRLRYTWSGVQKIYSLELRVNIIKTCKVNRDRFKSDLLANIWMV